MVFVRRILTILLLALCALIAACYFYSPTIIERIVRQSLEDNSFEDVQLQSSLPTPWSTEIRNLSVRTVRDNVYVTLQVDRIKLSYSPRSLWRYNLRQVALGRTLIELRQTNESRDLQTLENQRSQKASELELQNWPQLIPLNLLTAEQVLIRNEISAALPKELAFSLNLEKHPTKVKLAGRLTSPAKHSLLLNASLQSSGDLTVGISDSTELPDIDLQAKIQVRSSQISAPLKILSLEQQITLEGELTHNLVQQSGKLQLKSNALPLTAVTRLSKRLAIALPKELQLQKGSLEAKFATSWNSAKITANNLELKLSDATLKYRTVELTGVEAYWPLSNIAPFKMSKPASIKIDSYNPGVPISDIRARLYLQIDNNKSSNLLIEEISAGIFDGVIRSENFKYNLAKSSGKATLHVSNLDLAKILQLYPDAKLQGSGKLSGSLPVLLSGNNIQIAKGEIHSLSEGKLMLAPEASAPLKQQLGVVAETLENFFFDSLAATLELEKSGELKMGLQLSGNNPSYQNGRQINFNINISENLPALLKSLKITSDINTAIEENSIKLGQ